MVSECIEGIYNDCCMIKETLSREEWDDFFKGYEITGCTISDDNTIYISNIKSVARSKKKDGTNIISLFQRQNSDKLESAIFSLGELGSTRIGSSVSPYNRGLLRVEDDDGTVFAFNGKEYSKESIAIGQIPFIERIKCIGGYAWTAGNRREVYKRVSDNNWIAVNAGLSGKGKLFDLGFCDIDGFTCSDVYAVGGQGDIWHFDGAIWNKCSFPSNDELVAVCCTKNETYVYSESIGLWMGREHNWELVFEFDLSDSAQVNMRWFKNKLWIVHDYGILIWDGKNMQDKVVYQDSILPLRGKIDANQHMLVIANLAAVWTFDGQDWFEVVRPYDLYENTN